MELYRLLVILFFLMTTLELCPAVHLTGVDLVRIARSFNQVLPRKKRQSFPINEPQKFRPLGVNSNIDVPIPTNIGHFPGYSSMTSPTDRCDRDEVEMEDGTCQTLLTDGNCGDLMQVIIDPNTNKGFCAPRLCPIDRIFVPRTQLCHDPRDTSVCPPGRELYYSGFGTAVCTCPDGTVEGDDDLDDDVCEVLLSKSLQCPPGQVFWFENFNSPPKCLPDPCNGMNLNRGVNDLPFVPSKTGQCFRIGQTEGVCTNGTIYSLTLDDLQGECTSLEDAGYQAFDQNDLLNLINKFGPTITENNAPPIPSNNDGQVLNKPSQATFVKGVLASHIMQTISFDPPPSSKPPNMYTTNKQNYHTNIMHSSTPNQIQKPTGQTHHQVIIDHNGISVSKSIRPVTTQNVFPSIPQQNIITTGKQSINQFTSSFSNGEKTTNHHQVNNIHNNRNNNNQNNFNNNQKSNHKHITILPQQIVHQNPTTQFHQITQSPNQHYSVSRPVHINNQVSSQKVTIQQSTPAHNFQTQISSNHQFLNQNSNSPNRQSFNQNPQVNNPNRHSVNQPTHSINKQRLFQNTHNQFTQEFSHEIGLNPYNYSKKHLYDFSKQRKRPSHLQYPTNNRPFNQQSHNNPIQNNNNQYTVCHFEIINGRKQQICRQNSFKFPEVFDEEHIMDSEISSEIFGQQSHFGHRFKRSILPEEDKIILFDGLTRQKRNTKAVQKYKSILRESVFDNLPSPVVHSRRKRSLLPYASPSNVFETRLLGCRPGAARDINAKCRKTILPARHPKQRGTRAAPPVPPTPRCPSNMAFNIRRMCVPSNRAQLSLIAHNLG